MKKKYNSEYWFIVTARKNSKSIKRKNVAKIKGQELIKYAFEAIKGLKKIKKKIITTTDDEKVKKICKIYRSDVIHREKRISGDLISSYDVVLDV